MTKSRKDNSIVTELTSPGYLDRARQRARRRRSRWNLILIPLGLFGILVCFVGQFSLLWKLHTYAFPNHVGRLSEFWGKNISTSAFISSLLMAVSPFFSAIPLGMLLANCIAWCIPPARRVFAQEAEGVRHASFRQAMADLGKLALFTVPICFALGIIGALTLRSLK